MLSTRIPCCCCLVLDTDGDGLLSRADLSRGLQQLDPTLTAADLHTIVITLDHDKTGTIK